MKQYTILVVDDKPDNLKTLVDYLKESDIGYTILKAPNGDVACKLAMKRLPDLIITDWKMPIMNGIETIKYLKSQESTKNIPVIMATGVMTSPKNLKTALEAGAVDYIRKPIDKIELSARVNSMLKLSDSFKEIKALNTTKDKFFSIIAHDLKSPFSTMLGFLELLINEYDQYDVAERKDFISYVHQGVQKVYKLLENLLLWSHTQRGIIKFNPKKEKLNLLSIEAVELLNQLAIKKSISLINKVSEDIFVNADKNMLSTILRNLISNAIKYTHKGGEISINAKPISDENNQAYIEIFVEDTGIGISSEKISQLFEIAKHNSTKGTENEMGSGLGLMLCKEFVKTHGGEIWTESEEGKGSKFYFTIPAAV